MRAIRKGHEPHALKVHRTSQGATYDNLSANAKEALRQALARDQGRLCCYCMARIDPEPRPSGQVTMKIEHWAPQSLRPDLQLDFRNLLGACPGGQGSPPSQQHCDTRKGDQPITLDPLAPSPHPGQLRYLDDGSIEVDDPVLREDLNERLNLNADQLRANRSEALALFLRTLRSDLGPGKQWPKERLQREAERLQKPGKDGRLLPYVEVLLYWLRKRTR